MNSIIQQITDWLKGLLVSGIMNNLTNTFSSVNDQVGQIATEVGQTPSSFLPAVFNMVRNLSETVIMPIAGILLTFIACYELIQLIISYNNLASFETWFIWKWIFKTFVAVELITHTFDITMAVFDVSQSVVSRAGGIIQGSTAIDASTLATMQTTLEAMDLGPLLGIFLQSFVVQFLMYILAAIIFVIINGRMVEIYLMVSLAPIPFATFGNREQSMMGQNYVRSLFALGFQGFLIMVCVGIYAVLIQSVAFNADIIGSLWRVMGFTVLLAFTLFKTGAVGVSFNKIFAKLGSDYKKPDAITTMNKDEYREKAWPLPVSDLLYVGSATTKKLYSMGITTIGGLAQTDEKILIGRLGKMGSILWSFANGYDDSPVKIENTSAPVKSVGNSTTTPKDMETDEDVKIVLYILAESVAARLRENGFRCRTVEISLRDKDLYHFTKQVKLKNASNITKEIAEAGYRLYKESYRLPADEYEKQQLSPELFQKPLRSIGIRGSDLVTDYFWEQLDLFTDPGFREKQMKMDEAVDVIRRRFGVYSSQRGLMYRDRILSACDAKADHTVHPHGYFSG